jgi:hypothetical protein
MRPCRPAPLMLMITLALHQWVDQVDAGNELGVERFTPAGARQYGRKRPPRGVGGTEESVDRSRAPSTRTIIAGRGPPPRHPAIPP